MTMIVDLLLYFRTIFIIITFILLINNNISFITFIVSRFFALEQFTVLMR